MAMAVASAGPYANNQQPAPERYNNRYNTNTSSLIFLTPNQQRQSKEGRECYVRNM